VSERPPDARWYGSLPELIAEKRGAGVDAVIERIDKAAAGYPYADRYTPWPESFAISQFQACRALKQRTTYRKLARIPTVNLHPCASDRLHKNGLRFSSLG
jgi:hypothetical protein